MKKEARLVKMLINMLSQNKKQKHHKQLEKWELELRWINRLYVCKKQLISFRAAKLPTPLT